MTKSDLTTEEMEEDRDIQEMIKLLIDNVQSPELCFQHTDKGRTFTSGFTLRKLENVPELEIEVNAPIRVGGGGIVVQCFRKGIPSRKFALKAPRNSLIKPIKHGDTAQKGCQPDCDWEQVYLNRQENQRAAKLSHENVVLLIGSTDISRERDFPIWAQLMEWVDGAKDLATYIYEKGETPNHLVSVFCGVLSGLEYIHKKNLIHWDIKAANCLVSDSGVVKISDIGNARDEMGFGKKYGPDENAYTSKENAPEKFIKDIPKGEGSNRVCVVLKEGGNTYDRPLLDLYMFGRAISKILGFEKESEKKQELQREFIKRVLPSKSLDTEHIKQFFKIIVDRLVLPIEMEESLRYYCNAEEVIHDLRKLLNQFGDAHDVGELYPFSRQVIRIPVTRNTEYSARIGNLIDCAPIKRLKKHRQLALTYHIYPGVRHVRHEHVIGVIGKTLDYVRALYADRSSAHFRVLTNSLHIRALIFAAAVHDAGHVAFGHYLEECRALFPKCSHEEYIQAVLRCDPSLYGTDSGNAFKSDREALGECAKEWMCDLKLSKQDTVDKFLQLVADILRPEKPLNPKDIQSLNLLSKNDAETAVRYVLHSIIDSTIDADKLDYLKRDAHHGGLDYAWATDNDRFFQSLTTVIHPPAKSIDSSVKPTVAVTTKGVEPVECLLIARYQMFRAMYWNKKARSATAVLSQMVFRYFQLNMEKNGAQGIVECRKNLLDKLRDEDDDTSIIWLRDQLNILDTTVSGKKSVDKLAKSILDRQELPTRIYETSYSQCAPNEREKYLRILELHAWLHRQEASAYCDLWGRILSKTLAIIREKICAAQSGDAQDLYSEIFLDIPLQRSTDEVLNLYVVSGVGAKASPKPFDTYSVMGSAITDAFGIWAKQLRVFVSPDLAKKCSAVEKTDVIVFMAVFQAYTEVLSEYNNILEGDCSNKQQEKKMLFCTIMLAALKGDC